MDAEKNIHLLDSLKNLLEKQIEMARKGDLRKVESLVEQANLLVDEIGEAKCFDQPEFKDRCRYLQKLYKTLELTLTGEREYVGSQLRQLGNVRKTLAAYHDKG